MDWEWSIEVKGRRRVSLDRNKGGEKNCSGVGSNTLAAQQTISKSNSGPTTVSPITFEPGDCFYKLVESLPSADIHEKVGESPLVTPTSPRLPT